MCTGKHDVDGLWFCERHIKSVKEESNKYKQYINTCLPHATIEHNHEDCCPVCFMEYENIDTLTTLPCGHPFHKVCMTTWLSNKQHAPTCPICRVNVELGGEQDIIEKTLLEWKILLNSNFWWGFKEVINITTTYVNKLIKDQASGKKYTKTTMNALIQKHNIERRTLENIVFAYLGV